jgi:hypothetical protein
MSPVLFAGVVVTGPPADSAPEGWVDAVVVTGSELLEPKSVLEMEEMGETEDEDEDTGGTTGGTTGGFTVGFGVVGFSLGAVVGFGIACAIASCGWMACGGGREGGARFSKASQELSRDIFAED